MANISPDLYRGVIDGANKLIHDCEVVLGISSENGLFAPIIYSDDAVTHLVRISELIGALKVYMDPLKSPTIIQKYRTLYLQALSISSQLQKYI